MNDIQTILANLQNDLAASDAAARADLLQTTQHELGTLYAAAEQRGDQTAMDRINGAWLSAQQLEAHAAQADAKAAGALAAATTIAEHSLQVTDEYGRLVTALTKNDLSDPRIRDVHRDGFHDGYSHGQADSLDKEFFFAPDGDQLTQRGLPIAPQAMIAFCRFVFDPDAWIEEASSELKHQLADFIHAWTRRALVDVLITPAESFPDLDDQHWWNQIDDADALFYDALEYD